MIGAGCPAIAAEMIAHGLRRRLTTLFAWPSCRFTLSRSTSEEGLDVLLAPIRRGAIVEGIGVVPHSPDRHAIAESSASGITPRLRLIGWTPNA